MNELITNEVYARVTDWATGYCISIGVLDYDERQDYIGVAHEALMKAAQTFDPEAGTLFTTWAYFVMKQEFAGYHTQREAGLVPLPEKRAELWRQCCKTRDELLHWSGVSPSPAHIADAMEMDLRDYFKLRDECTQEWDSLDYVPLDDEGEDEEAMHDVIKGPSPDPFLLMQSIETRQQLDEGVDGLLSDEQIVVRALYGLDGYEYTQEEVSEATGWSQSSVSRLLQSALTKLRNRGVGV